MSHPSSATETRPVAHPGLVVTVLCFSGIVVALTQTMIVPLVPILGILTCLAMMVSLDGETWLRLVIWLAIGMVIYFGWSRRHSRVGREGA